MAEMLSFRQTKSVAAAAAPVNSGVGGALAPTFDADGRLRILDPEHFAQTEELERESRDFVAGEYRMP